MRRRRINLIPLTASSNEGLEGYGPDPKQPRRQRRRRELGAMSKEIFVLFLLNCCWLLLPQARGDIHQDDAGPISFLKNTIPGLFLSFFQLPSKQQVGFADEGEASSHHRKTRLTGFGSRSSTSQRKHYYYPNNTEAGVRKLLLCQFAPSLDNRTKNSSEDKEFWLVMEQQEEEEEEETDDAKKSDTQQDRKDNNGNKVVVRLDSGRGDSDRGGVTLLSNVVAVNYNDRDWENNTNHVAVIPVEGLFGIYQLPSGQLWVWIGHSKSVYCYHYDDNDDDDNDDDQSDREHPNRGGWFWNIRKIDQFHLLHIPNHRGVTTSKKQQTQQRVEEMRQLTLLRRALKEQDWYFCHGDTENNNNNNENGSQRRINVPDMTRNLQSCFLLYNNNDDDNHHHRHHHNIIDNTTTTATAPVPHSPEEISSKNDKDCEETTDQPDEPNIIDGIKNLQGMPSILSSSSWWNTAAAQQRLDSPESESSSMSDETINAHGNRYYPDRRFFWNEGVLEPLLQHYYRHCGNNNDTTATAAKMLLDWSIPVTSAFVGVQRKIPFQQSEAITQQDDDDDDTTDNSNDLRNKNKIETKTSYYDQLIISRRSKWRAGTRFTKRGADASGNVANYVETEQVVFLHDVRNDGQDQKEDETKKKVFSHVQIRGSIPLRWSSPTDIKTYRPRVLIGTDPLAQARAMKQHLLDVTRRFLVPFSVLNHYNPKNEKGSVSLQPRMHPGLVLVNLVDKKSDQGRLGRAMDAVLQAVLDVHEQNQQKLEQQRRQLQKRLRAETPNEDDGDQELQQGDSIDQSIQDNSHLLNSKMIRHKWFDFHAEVKGGRWDQLQSLLVDLSPTLEEQSFFEADLDKKGHWKIKRLQTGVVRTNCMDSLDRTNVVQSIFGRQVLLSHLRDEYLESSSGDDNSQHLPIEALLALPWSTGEAAHRRLWADNADAISRIYAGTPALKRDFTRTGKRTTKGAWDDGMNSLQRYYLNNFLDADRQEGMDLLTRHQDFADGYYSDNTNDDDDDDADRGGKGKNKSRSIFGSSMTIQDAARQLISGGGSMDSWQSMLSGESWDDDESNHVRAKFQPSRLENPKSARMPYFRWLPGDLQSQMRNLASSSPALKEGFAEPSLLQAMDQRAASDVPWWVLTDDSESYFSHVNKSNKSDDNDNYEDNRMVYSVANAIDLANRSAFIVAGSVASTKAPLATAALVLSLLGISLAAAATNDDDQ